MSEQTVAGGFQLQIGEMYAITTDLTQAAHGGTFLGYLFLDEDVVWLAFEAADKVKFYNPRFIRTLLPDRRPEP